MTTTYDYIIIGGGITGSALSYELANLGSRVLLLEKETHPLNATFYSYGGLAYWSQLRGFSLLVGHHRNPEKIISRRSRNSAQFIPGIGHR